MYNCLRLFSYPFSGSFSTLRSKVVRRLSVAFLLGTLGCFSTVTVAIAQQVSPELRQSFLEDPLTSDPPDPLLPTLTVERDYSPLERAELARSLDQLNRTAAELYLNGQIDQAFQQWRREIKLRRVLGPRQEFAVIAQVAELAWAQQRITDIQLLTLRSREIWDVVQMDLGTAEADSRMDEDENGEMRSPISGAPTADIAFLTDLARTFEVLRDHDSSVAVYEQIDQLRQAEFASEGIADLSAEREAERIRLAELHLDWFEFAEASNIYLELLTIARANGDGDREQRYLEKLAYSYQQADSLLNATRAQTDLLTIYQAKGEEEKLPEMLVAIAQNYRTLNLHASAIDYYRAAYREAQRFDQFSFSAQVLKELGSLYESLALTDEALGAYTLLVPVERQAYNDYGIMNAQDKIGQLQRRQGNLLEALKAFERALVIANRLGVREEYFVEQIESVS